MTITHDYINLLPREEKKAGGLGRGRIVIILFLLAWGAAFSWQAWQALAMKRQIRALDWKKQALLQQLASSYTELGITAPADLGKKKSALVATLLGERVLWSEVFKQFSRIVPKGLWFDNLEGTSATRAEIKIKGGAFNYLSIAEFMLGMEKSNYFERPQLMYAQKSTVQGQDVIGFEIICGIKKGEVR
jgi:Tfp pilus assembly protein PilN